MHPVSRHYQCITMETPMARPIVFGAEPNIPDVLALALVIPAKSVPAVGRRLLIKPTCRQHPARRLNPRLRSTPALVRNYRRAEARSAERRFETDVIYAIERRTVVREINRCLVPAALAQPVHMDPERLTHALVVIQDPDLTPDKLRDPHGKSVGFRPRAADVAVSPDLQQRIFGNPADPTFTLRIRQELGVVSASMRRRIVALPYVRILFRPFLLVLSAYMGGRLCDGA